MARLGRERPLREVVTPSWKKTRGKTVRSCQGGHVGYFGYLAQSPRDAGAGYAKAFGGEGTAGREAPKDAARTGDNVLAVLMDAARTATAPAAARTAHPL